MKFKWDEFFVTGDPLILGAQVSIGLTTIALIFVLTYFKKWKWLWSECTLSLRWLCCSGAGSTA
jgi:cytochrome aa3-600 menaquinol oxidase subunit 1